MVTISASYGAGGAYVGPRLAERLGVPFVDRVIPNEVAQRLAVPLAEAIHHDESAGSAFERFIRALAPAGMAFGARPFLDHEIVDENAYRDATEQVVREQAEREGGVFLGPRRRAGAGQHAARVARAAVRAARGADGAGDGARGDPAQGGRRRFSDDDRARQAYVQHFYGADPNVCGTTTWRSIPPRSRSTGSSS